MGCSGLSCTNRDSIAIFPQVSWEFGCVSPPTEFTEVWLRKSSHRIHRSLVASVLPRNSRNSQKFCCVGSPTEFTELHRWLGCVCSPTEFTEFTEVLLCRYPHGIHRIHRSLGVLLAAWVWQDAIPSYICVNPCYLWKPLLCQKVLCIPWVLWEYSLPRISQICTDGLVASVLPRNSQNSQKFWGAVGCVGMAGCHTLLICAHLCQSVGGTSLPEGSVHSVGSVGI